MTHPLFVLKPNHQTEYNFIYFVYSSFHPSFCFLFTFIDEINVVL